jgi:hypothetical protein
MDNIIFIISHKYYNGYNSYIIEYIENINIFYNNATILIVDNNSLNFGELKNKTEIYDNIIFIENEDACKFELGAYNYGIKYLKDNLILENYEYFIFTQDTFIIKNKYDFNNLMSNKIDACSIVSWTNDWSKFDICENILKSINKFDTDIYNTKLCWCNSFILSKNKVTNFYEITKDIVITKRIESEASERYLGKILYDLNNKKNNDIDGDIDELDYYCHTSKISDNTKHYFIKISQQKNENTKNY